MRHFFIFFISVIILSGCAGTPISVKPVTNFEPDRYLGTWYEVARLDHSFERGLTDVTANYTKRSDGAITVLNRGYDTKKEKFDDAKGKAKFKINENTGHLKVSFFGPFYGDYIIFDLDKTNYNTAYVSGGKDNYLWLLSRNPEINNVRKEHFIQKAHALGYDTDALIWVDQSRAGTRAAPHHRTVSGRFQLGFPDPPLR